MNLNKTSGLMITLAVILCSCSPLVPTPDQPTTTEIQEINQTITDTPTLLPTATDSPQQDDQEVEYFPLAEQGSYWVGHRSYTLVDNSRSGREIRITIWYPAEKINNSSGQPISLDALPDLSGAPYPLILTGANSGDLLFKSHLASTGFVMVIVHSPGFHYEDPWGPIVIEGPRDFLFTLDQLASSPPEDLVDLIDTNQVGVAGYSWDGFFTLALSGVRIDPEFYLSQCALAPTTEPALSPSMQDYYCDLAKNWDQFSDLAGEEITQGEDGLWQPLTDERIRAVMPMAPDGAWLYGESGLAAVKKPALIITGTNDDISPYVMETVYIFEHLGSADRSLISFIGKGHMMVFNSEQILRMKHFTTAFFGYYLQGHTEYLDYFSEDYVNKFDDLAWGVYEN